jgi:LPXTG-motif cell wall-anchored protein
MRDFGNVYYRDPRLDGWKNQGLFSKVFVLNERKDKGPITFTITAKLPDGEVQEFPFVAVMKRYKQIAPTEATSLAATTFEKEPKIILNPLSPETPDPTPKNPAPEEPKSNPETPKENPNEQIQVTFKEGDGTGNTPDTATHYIFGGQIIKMVQPGTLLKSILPMIKIASPGYKPQKGDFILQKGYRIKGWIDENRNPVSEDTLIHQSMILTPIIETDDTTQTPEMPKVTPEKPKNEPEEPKVTPEKPKTEPELPKVTPEKPKTEPETPKVTPEKPKTEPEAPKVTPEKPKTEPKLPKVTPEKPKTEPELPKSEPELPKSTPEKPKTEPELPKSTPEKPKNEPEEPKSTPEKPKSEPELPKSTPEKPKSEPDVPKMTRENPSMDQEAPKNKQDTSQVPRHSAKVGQSNSTSRPTTIIPATKNATLPNTGEKSNILAWLGGILAAILVGILALKAKNSKK